MTNRARRGLVAFGEEEITAEETTRPRDNGKAVISNQLEVISAQGGAADQDYGVPGGKKSLQSSISYLQKQQ
jgi:hypothetical protein